MMTVTQAVHQYFLTNAQQRGVMLQVLYGHRRPTGTGPPDD